jgi:uncharacterized membrane protein YoaK (UPF0700 family)
MDPAGVRALTLMLCMIFGSICVGLLATDVGRQSRLAIAAFAVAMTALYLFADGLM